MKSLSRPGRSGGLHMEPFYIVIRFAPSRYGVAVVTRASQKQVVNVAQHGGMCAVMVSAKAIHGTSEVTRAPAP